MNITVEWLLDMKFERKVRKSGTTKTDTMFKLKGLYLTKWNRRWHWQVGGTANKWQSLNSPTKEFVRQVLQALASPSDSN